ncbi:MAG: hypothetical protein HKN25_16865 [Pyrinomonadaceae bacterium]|nr:hypothetical protein [Pyrinomonadaceae bacterium]
MKRYKTVEEFIKSQTQWKKELIALRKIINSTELVETVKWGMPVYTVGGKNVVGIGSFKSYVGVWFYQGAFLKDKHKKLINAQEGRTKGMRQWRMKSADEIDEKLLIEYLEEAIQNQKDGKEIKPEKKALIIPDELKKALKDDSKLKKAFEKFTPGKQKEFAEYISEAKQDATKQKRLAKIAPMILENVGLNDKYK